MDLATVMDRLAIDELVTHYAVAVDDADWNGYRTLFTRHARVDYRGAGGVEGPAAEVADWLAESMRLFPVRQHLIVNRRLRIQDLGGYPGDGAELRADYTNALRGESGDDVVSGGRCAFGVTRTDGGWRLSGVMVEEKWRRVGRVLSG
ncbi:nuclear transport factor 2 family protein [Streptomyces katsurahamanus]|uniref:Nuclear transport factor 2 family protein n=2 Tax=Streptomyces TaxID=1883 RepID=A0A646KFT7_STRJU|nr:nuclear transport factor 2 family protein [Streptomyces katsurahamanus]MQT00930.1 nuclear transport factor 2 family protein [Streptomyces jumonjinensis]